MQVGRKLVSLFAEPKGIPGWIMAWIMPTFSEGQSRQLAALLDLQPDDKFLEIACGSGSLLNKYATHVSYVAGLDHSEVQIKMARWRNRQRIDAGTAEIVYGDAASLPWSSGRFSAVGCNCFSCLPKPRISIDEMYRVLRPGGRVIFITDYFPDEQSAIKAELTWGLPTFTSAKMRTMMEDAGFSQININPIKHNLVVGAIKD